MKLRSILAVIALTLGLAGCFISEKPLIPDSDAVAPYAKITFSEKDSKEQTVLTRTGKEYIAKGKETTLTFRLRQVDPDVYLVELSGKDKNNVVQRLYGLIKLDKKAGTATAYKAMAEKTDIGPGLRECKEGLCIDDLNAYLALAKAAMAAGGKPDTVYKVKLE